MNLFDFQMKLSHHALDMMARGVPINDAKRKELARECHEAMLARVAILEEILKRELPRNKQGLPTLFRSPKQMAELFAVVGGKAGTNRKTGRPTYDDETLFALAKQKPKLATICYAIMEFRSLGQMVSTFCSARLDPDGRMRCTFNTAGPETFRLSSSKNAFGRGTNLQNVTTGDRSLTGHKLPNLRTAIIPPPGMILFEPDLAGADARVVAWDANDALMKQLFREGWSLHAELAKDIYGASAGKDGRTEPYYTLAKKGRHLWNYAGKAKTMANSLGILVADAEKIIKRLEALHPGVVEWHKRIKSQLYATKTITNQYGYRIVFFDRIDDGLVGDALAWIGQGTIACVTNRVWDRLVRDVPEAQIIINNHDSLPGLCELTLWPGVKPRIKAAYEAEVVPYPDPLVIPPELKVSLKSWGEMTKESW